MDNTVGGIPTMDIEAVGWVHPIAVGFFDGQEYHEFIKEHEGDDVLWRFLTFLRSNFGGMKLYAHCASRYDNKLVLSSLIQHNEVAIPEAGLIRLRWKDPNILFEDSYLLIPMPLREAIRTFGGEEKGEWAHEKGLHPWEMGQSLQVFREYLRRDCLSLSQAMFGLCETLGLTFGATPSISLSTTAAKVLDKCFYPLDKVEAHEEFEEPVRKALYGTRNEVYRRFGKGINLYDVRSMFVSCYDVPVPIGKMEWVKPNLDTGTLIEADVQVPKDWYLGPLPCKLDGRLVFPTGEFRGWWDRRELAFASKLGIDIILRRQLNCEELPILKDFGVFVSRLRIGRTSNFWKMFGLSISGKFGQSRWRDTIRHISNIKDLEGFTPIDKEEQYFQTKEYTKGRAPYIRPTISMRIRSEARVRHLQILLEAQSKGLLFYCDTDSVYTEAKLETGEEVGKLAFIGKAERGYFIRQKLYGLILDGKVLQRSSGFSDVRLTEEDFKLLLGGEDILLESGHLPPLLGIFGPQGLQWLEKYKVIKGFYGEDNRVLEGQDTRPIYLKSNSS